MVPFGQYSSGAAVSAPAFALASCCVAMSVSAQREGHPEHGGGHGHTPLVLSWRSCPRANREQHCSSTAALLLIEDARQRRVRRRVIIPVITANDSAQYTLRLQQDHVDRLRQPTNRSSSQSLRFCLVPFDHARHKALPELVCPSLFWNLPPKPPPACVWFIEATSPWSCESRAAPPTAP